MAKSVTKANNDVIAGINAPVELWDTSNNIYQILPDATNGCLKVTKNGSVIGFTGLRKVTAKTAAYTILVSDLGTIFTNLGTSALVNFTLPAASSAGAGWWCEIFSVDADGVTITSDPADKFIGYQDADLDSVTIAAIGSGYRMVSDGTNWMGFPMLAGSADGTTIQAQTLTD